MNRLARVLAVMGLAGILIIGGPSRTAAAFTPAHPAVAR
jgi:hypothetical protein